MKNVLALSTIIVIALSMVVLGIGCEEVSEPGPTPGLNTGVSGIDLALNNFVKAYETKDIDLLKRCLTEESSFYSELVINAQSTFARHEKIEMEFTDPAINLYDGERRATVSLKGVFKGIGKDDVIIKEIRSGDIFELIKDEAGWKIVSWYRDIYMSEPPSE